MQFDVSAAIEVLERTPRVLRSLLEDLPDAWLRADEGAGSFRPLDVVGHLLHGERTDWMSRARQILDVGPDRAFDAFDRQGHADDVRAMSPPELLSAFERAREESLAELRELNLAPTDLEREGRHPDFGVVTLGQLLSTWVVHDLGHLRQICRVMARQYAHAVGPWRAYLPVLEEGPAIEPDA